MILALPWDVLKAEALRFPVGWRAGKPQGRSERKLPRERSGRGSAVLGPSRGSLPEGKQRLQISRRESLWLGIPLMFAITTQGF